MPRVGFEPTISAGERPQTYAFDRAATRTGKDIYILVYIILSLRSHFIRLQCMYFYAYYAWYHYKITLIATY